MHAPPRAAWGREDSSEPSPQAPELPALVGGEAPISSAVPVEPSPPPRSPSRTPPHRSPRASPGAAATVRRPVQLARPRGYVASGSESPSAPSATVGCVGAGVPHVRPLVSLERDGDDLGSAPPPEFPGQITARGHSESPTSSHLEPVRGGGGSAGQSWSKYPAPLPPTRNLGPATPEALFLQSNDDSQSRSASSQNPTSANGAEHAPPALPAIPPPGSGSPVGSALAVARGRTPQNSPQPPAGASTSRVLEDSLDTCDGSPNSVASGQQTPIGGRRRPYAAANERSRAPVVRSESVRRPTLSIDASQQAMGASSTSFGASPQRQITGLMTPLGSSANSSFYRESPMPSLGMRQYTVDRRKPLGSGASGTVYSGFDTIRGDHVAVKMAHVGGAAIEQASAEFEAEFRTLTQLAHENIVGVRHLELVPEKGEAAIVMEWVPGGSIASVLERQRFRLHELVVRRYLREALLGVEYLHANGVLHRDLKPANLLLAGNGTIKVSDFGTSRILGGEAAGAVNATHNTKAVVGTPAYMAPELISAGKCSKAVDIWAIAATAVEMLSGKAPWAHLPRHKRQPVPLMFHIGMAQPPDHHPRIPPHVSPPLRALLERCFSFKPRKRPSATELLEDTYFSFENMVRAAAAQSSADPAAAAALPPVSPDALAAELGMENIGEYADARQLHEERAFDACSMSDEESELEDSDDAEDF